MALRFYGTGAFLGNIAEEEDFLTSKRPVSESIHAVSTAIIRNLAPRYLKFPTSPEEKLRVKRELYEIAGLPGCLGTLAWHSTKMMYTKTCKRYAYRQCYNISGAIDGTAVAIIAPSMTDPRFVDGNYYCHKGYHAINVLGVR